MLIDSKPRDFSYIKHKNNYPLQLKGTMRHRSRPNERPSNCCTVTFQNKNDPMAQKIINNYVDVKSVLPTDYSCSRRKESVRTYEKEKYLQVSGAAYLMMKSRVERDHPERRHLTDRDYLRCDNESGHKQKRHICPPESVGPEQKQPAKKHSLTLYQKLTNDIYSRIEVKENIVQFKPKMPTRSMFTEGIDLGYEQSREPRISCAKRREVIGSASKPEKENNKNYRNDWRQSSIVFG